MTYFRDLNHVIEHYSKKEDKPLSKEMELEITKLKERDKCEECVWEKKDSMCESCRLSEGNSYFMPNLFTNRLNKPKPREERP